MRKQYHFRPSRKGLKAYIEGREKIVAAQFTIDPEPDYENIQSPDDLPY